MGKSNASVKQEIFGLIPDNELHAKFADPQKTAKFLGVELSWLYERTRKGQIPHFKIGKYLRFDPEEVREWMNQFRVKKKASDKL